MTFNKEDIMNKRFKIFAIGIFMAMFCLLLVTGCATESYAITKEAAEHGTFEVTINGQETDSSQSGVVVSVTVFPDEGCEAISCSVVAGENEVSVMKSGADRYSFTMPASDVSVSVVFQYIPDEYAPDSSIQAQQGFQSAELLLYPDNSFEYTYVTTGSQNGATLTTTRVYVGSFLREENFVVLTCTQQEFTYSFSHPQAEKAKSAYEKFVEEHGDELTSTMPSANTAISAGASQEIFEFELAEDENLFGLRNEAK